MYGEWVTIANVDGFRIKIFINCVPDTDPNEKRNRAIELLKRFVKDL